MRSFRLACALVLVVSFARADLSGSGNAPAYSAASIVNAATQTQGPLAPNTIATVYGTNLSWETYGITSADVNGGMLPQSVQGVAVFVGGFEAGIFYVSPTQINFLIPYELIPGTTKIYVARNGVRGPDAVVQLNQSSPGFFEWSGNLAVAEHADGSVISADSPASAGETIVLYAAGLGYTTPATESGRIVQQATWITSLANLQVLLNGNPCPAQNILYAGLTPQTSGLYQINLRLPDSLSPNPVIQIALGSDISPNTVQLPTR
jgi:uncharacterized protein (TIGR03437 family)